MAVMASVTELDQVNHIAPSDMSTYVYIERSPQESAEEAREESLEYGETGDVRRETRSNLKKWMSIVMGVEHVQRCQFQQQRPELHRVTYH